MRQLVGATLIILSGCSTAPVAGLMDCVFPSKADRTPLPPRDRDPFRDGPDWNSIPPPPVLGPSSRVEPLPPPVGMNAPVAPTTGR
jgi:hypothetical protein